MKKIIIFLIFIGTQLINAQVTNSYTLSIKDWALEVTLPSKPQVNLDIDANLGTKTHYASVTTENEGYIVVASKAIGKEALLALESLTLGEMYQMFYDKATSLQPSKFLSSSHWELAGKTGRKFRYSTDEGKKLATMYTLFIDDTIYAFYYLSEAKNPNHEASQNFFKSISLKKPTKPSR
ncbi:hypothetical protein [Roseibacillus persicicus]|uniref:PsbP C-terminal domain-containing protein n=1 Tax=Roseibacillus persicicus TaxID=454148 RepID=A0A918WF96_9BACT|nr:hypothetical protein [Roseibacillus persicicus]GHC43052.1 hypothetical protein GCM10007100_05110 [Roseibacillus persicicus]